MTNGAGAADGEKCNGLDCAYSPHLGCMDHTFGDFVSEKMEWRTDALWVHSKEYTAGSIWLVTYGHAQLEESDVSFLDSVSDLASEAEVSWTANLSVIAPGARLHGYGLVS